MSRWAGLAALLFAGTLLGGAGVVFALLALLRRKWGTR
jgi:hypothetical protein